MSRFLLDDETIRKITDELPRLEDVGTTVMMLAPDLISVNYLPDSNVPVAAVCLQDTLDALLQVRIGLNECIQHKIWFREKCDPPNTEHAIIYMRFFVDAVVSQLYAAGEHLANAIICMLEITEGQLESYRNGRVSQQSILGHYLVNEQADHPITKAVLVLAKSPEWEKTLAYRNRWVHEQPPTVSGIGTIYRRRRRWVQSKSLKWAMILGIGTEDKAEYSIDEVLNFVLPATFQFVELLENIVDYYLDSLGKKGITLSKKGINIDIFRA
jgi:hypothetical protein